MKLAHNPTYANFLPRLLATVIDSAIPSLVSLFFLLRLIQSQTVSQLITGLLQTLATVWLPMSLIYGPVLVLLLYKTGYTPGKWLAGIKIANLTLIQTIIREWIAKRVSAALLMAGYFAILVDPNHQSWHDHLVGTLALKTRSNIIPAAMLAIVVIGFQLYLWYLIITTALTNQNLIADITFIFEPLINSRTN